MLEQLRFYIRHSLNDLRVNGRRTIFALLCIAAGVSAVVSLQTLSVMIQDTLTGSLQEANRGDIRMTVRGALAMGPGNADDATDPASALVAQGEAEGMIVSTDQSVFGQQITDVDFSPEAMDKIRAWFDENYPGALQAITGRQPLNAIFMASVNAPARGTQASFVTEFAVDSSVFPLYGQIRSVDGRPLSDILSGPSDVVLSEGLAERLEAQPGDVIRLSGSTTDFTLSAIVPDRAEAGIQGIFAGLFGFLYVDDSALASFSNAAPGPNALFLRLSDAVTADEARLEDINQALLDRYPYLNTTSTGELRAQNTQVSDTLNQLVTVMGLISLLIGGIGIVNTMQVIVRRRTVEIAVLKAMGLQAGQVTTLFLVQALIMGVVGSLAGILLGWAMTFVIRGAAESFLGQTLAFRITPTPAINGLVVGTFVTAIFGFLPTLTAGLVRPGVVLRPTDSPVPRVGLLRSVGALLIVILALALVAQTVLGSFSLALAVIVGAFIAAGMLYLMLWALVYLVGRFFPNFRIVDLTIALRSMFVTRRRVAITLLALAVGVFSLSLITLMASTISNLFESLLVDQTGGNVIVFTGGANAQSRAEATLSDFDGVKSYAITGSYTVTPLEVRRADGTVIAYQDLKEQAIAAADVGNARVQDLLQSITARDVTSNLPRANFTAGRNLEPSDAGQPVLVMSDATLVAIRRGGPPTQINLGLTPGDEITFALDGSDERITLEVVGLKSAAQVSMSFESSVAYAPRDAFPAGTAPNQVSAIVDVDEARIPALQREFTNVPGAFLLETKFLNEVLNTLLEQFTAFPMLVAALGLFVGGVVIANSVALTTMERRREIAVMKAVGLQRERVLGMILLENAFMGLIGGLIGVGIGLVGLIMFQTGLQFLSPGADLSGVVPYGTA
ncbi:MAG: ABC transporter permease, partial [Anaerolineae bacterium]|nr:ABC transporter permease [Anaerolineae bacterium]